MVCAQSRDIFEAAPTKMSRQKRLLTDVEIQHSILAQLCSLEFSQLAKKKFCAFVSPFLHGRSTELWVDELSYTIIAPESQRSFSVAYQTLWLLRNEQFMTGFREWLRDSEPQLDQFTRCDDEDDNKREYVQAWLDWRRKVQVEVEDGHIFLQEVFELMQDITVLPCQPSVNTAPESTTPQQLPILDTVESPKPAYLSWRFITYNQCRYILMNKTFLKSCDMPKSELLKKLAQWGILKKYPITQLTTEVVTSLRQTSPNFKETVGSLVQVNAMKEFVSHENTTASADLQEFRRSHK